MRRKTTEKKITYKGIPITFVPFVASIERPSYLRNIFIIIM